MSGRFEFNFIAVTVAAFEPALRVYTEGLGFGVRERKADWAWLDGDGLTFELFGGGVAVPAATRAWGRGQAARPRLEYGDLEEARGRLRALGLEPRPYGGILLLRDPEGVTWSLAEAAVSSSRPRVAGVELKVADLGAQARFYTQVMGLRRLRAAGAAVELAQGEPPTATVALVGGGERAAAGALRPEAPRAAYPVVLTFETGDLDEALAWLGGHGVAVAQPRTLKPWGGLDAFVLDADGHPLQVVQYVEASAAPRRA